MWEKVKLGDVCEVTNGYAFKSSQYVNLDGARVIRITNVQKGKIIDNDPKLYPFNLLNGLSNFEIFENDILMSLTGNVGRVGLFPKEMLPAYLNQRVCKIEPISNKILKQYLFHYLNSDGFEKEAMNASGGAAQLNLSSNWVNSYVIPLPPLPIQEKIAEILDKADELRRKDKDLQAKYDELAQALFIDMFGDPVKNEKGWEVKKLEEVTEVGSSRRVFVDELVESGIPFYRGTEIGELATNNSVIPSLFISKEHYEKLKLDCGVPQKGDLLLPSICPDGRIWVVDNSNEFYYKDGRVLHIKIKSNFIDSIYLKNHLKYLFLNNYTKIASGTTFAELKIFILKNIEIQIPPIHLQEAFAKKIELINQLKAQTNAEKSEELFQSLLQKAFKGELTID